MMSPRTPALGLAVPSWDALPGMVLLLDSEGAACFANDALCAFTGQRGEALLGAGWLAVLATESRRDVDTALARGADFHLRLQVLRDAERIGFVDCSARWLADRSLCVCLLHDVTAGSLAQTTAQSQASLFRLLADNVPVLIAYYRAGDYRCQFANKGYARTFGRDEHSIIGLTFAEVIGQAAAAQIQPYVDQVLHEGRAARYERQLRAADGSPQWIEVNLLPHQDPGSAVIGAFVLISDITRHRLADIAVRESEQRLEKFMQASVEGIVFHRDGFITDANPPICELTGYSLEDMLGRRTLDFIAPEEVARVAAVIASGQETAYESLLLDKRGERIPVEFIVRTMVRGGERMRMTIVRDIRDRHAAQARIHHLAHHDALTGLPNRMAFMQQLEQQLASARVSGGVLALLFIDLDHFKRVNDSLGHLAGDTLLRAAAARIVGSLRATDLVARFGGDEFMVLLPGLSAVGDARAHAEEVAHKLLRAVEAPLVAEGRPISVTPSVGIAMFPGHGDTADDLVKNADAAMYQAKARGRANYQFFDPGLAGSAYAAFVLEGELAQALARGEFELHFQAQVACGDGNLAGAEALIRWNHPQRGLLLPDTFIPVAERQRLMLPIGQWVLAEAIRHAARWRAAGLALSHIAVNLSTVQFQSAGFVESVARLLAEHGAAGSLLELELTERMLMDDLVEVKQRLVRLKALGLQISVDDFGTGYSSLAHLKELPIDKLKIDRSFVADLPGRQDSAAIARAIIQMGRSLGLTVIAEGVETQAQLQFLAAQGCDEVQGNFIGAPAPAAQFEAWLRTRRAGGGGATSAP
jgi:diguanylate cyclase (GGDEF)-like protein/PAS domain S-box-containing protein